MSIKRCIKCNGIIYNGCCIKCGLMDNNVYIKKEKNISKYDEYRNYNEDFDLMFHNDNGYIPFLIGHLYFSYRNYLFLGIISEVLEIIAFIGMYYYLDKLVIFSNIIGFFVFTILTFVIVRLQFYLFSNKICLALDKKKIKKYKEKNLKFKSKIKLFINLLIDLLLMYFIF